MFWFALASLTPVGLLALAALFGGGLSLVALLSMTVLVFFLDKLANRLLPEDHAHDGLALSYVLAAAHLALLPLVIWAVGAGTTLGTLDKILVVCTAGLWLGQVSNSNAHELIHRRARLPRRLGRVLYASILYGHHATAHLRVHHVHACTDRDPNSARPGEGFWSFALRCAVGEFREGLRAENAARAARHARPSPLSHPYLQDAAVSAASLVLAFAQAGWPGVLTLVVLALYAAWQLMLSDYVQHYGLRRRILANGKPEAMGPQHSWNTPRWYSSAMMLNAPRHSDHHMSPGRPYPALRIDRETMPVLPQSLPVMACIALVPPLWRRLMERRVRIWRAPQEPATTRRARDIPQEVPDRARGSGAPGPALTEWAHDAPDTSPCPGRSPLH